MMDEYLLWGRSIHGGGRIMVWSAINQYRQTIKVCKRVSERYFLLFLEKSQEKDFLFSWTETKLSWMPFLEMWTVFYTTCERDGNKSPWIARRGLLRTWLQLDKRTCGHWELMAALININLISCAGSETLTFYESDLWLVILERMLEETGGKEMKHKPGLRNMFFLDSFTQMKKRNQSFCHWITVLLRDSKCNSP